MGNGVGCADWQEYLIDCYRCLLCWTLTHDWDWSDKYKAFRFRYPAPSSEHRLAHFGTIGTRLSHHGQCLRTLANLLVGPIAPWQAVTTQPKLHFGLVEDDVHRRRVLGRLLSAHGTGGNEGPIRIIGTHIPEGRRHYLDAAFVEAVQHGRPHARAHRQQGLHLDQQPGHLVGHREITQLEDLDEGISEPGLGGGKLSVGWGRAIATTGKDGRFLTNVFMALAGKATVLRTWGDYGAVESGRTYAGAGLDFSVARVNFGLGILYRVSSGDDSPWLVTGGIGWGF